MKIRKMINVLLATMIIASMVLTGCGKKEEKEETVNTKEPATTEETDKTKGPEPTKATPAETTKAADKIIIFQSKVEITD